jgi:hypothetical protein
MVIYINGTDMVLLLQYIKIADVDCCQNINIVDVAEWLRRWT